MNQLQRRAVLTERTRGKFFGRPFKWGSADCAKAAAFHLKAFGWKVPPPGRYDTAAGAVARLAALGHDTLPDLIAAVGLTEIAPARMLPGDIVSFASDHRLGAVGIVLGNSRMLAFHEDAEGMAIIAMEQVDRMWSVWNG